MRLEDLDDLVHQQDVTLVDFWAGWCGPCKKLVPVLDSLVVETPGLRVVKVNIDDSPELAHHFRVMSVPMLALFVGGKLAAVRTGFAPLTELRAWVGSHV